MCKKQKHIFHILHITHITPICPGNLTCPALCPFRSPFPSPFSLFPVPKPTVAILGGGVAGMSAAHELAERGFAVEVFERQPHYVGGKARSTNIKDSGTDGRAPLPGEHGFRFFPGFYRHITDTMKRIPYGQNPQGVFDNLVASQRVMLARYGQAPLTTIVNFPKSIADLEVLINSLLHSDTGLTEADKKLFVARLWQLITSSYERRQQDYERISWWQYMSTDAECAGRVPCPYQSYCVGGLTRSLVAAQPQLMSTKTGGDILLQLLLLLADPTAHTDRVLSGPTNDVWLDPWLRHLREGLGVQFHQHHLTIGIDCDAASQRITGARVKDLTSGVERTITADYYIAAVPLERMSALLTPQLLKADPTLGCIEELRKRKGSLNWMNGIQFYLSQDVVLAKGHVICIDSEWAVTIISQAQFWPNYPLSGYGNGEVKGLLSVDVSDWFTPGLNKKLASECTIEEIIDEVWAQMEKSLNGDGSAPPLITKSMVLRTNVDSDIREVKAAHAVGAPADRVHAQNPFTTDHNSEPLLVNTANSWSLRPEAATGIANFFLASDYVRTNTDLATMEGANEAARRATNAIIGASGLKVPYCKVWPLHEPDILAVLRWLDRRRFAKGLPWTNELGWLGNLLHEANHWYHRLRGVTK